MKVVILCGGQGSRIKDIADIMPKPMLSIGDRPILWHIMKIYAHYGFKDFVLCLGYKGWQIKEFFLHYYAKMSDITIDLKKNDSVVYHNSNNGCDWKITLVETGEEALTGARVRSAGKYLKDDNEFCLTYGDGLADVNLKDLLETHQNSGLDVTVTGVRPSGRFGEIEANGQVIQQFNEKPNVSAGLINGGFMIFNTSVIDQYFEPEGNLNLEKDVIPKIVKDQKVGVYKHGGFWECMDTPREYQLLNQLWNDGQAPWKVW